MIPVYSLGNALQSISTFGQQQPSSTITVDAAHVEASFNPRVPDANNGQLSPTPQSSADPVLPESNQGFNRIAPEGFGFLIQVQGGEGTPGGYVGNPPAPVPFDISKANYEAVFTALGGASSAADSLFAQIDRNGDGVIGQDELLARGDSNNPALAAGNLSGWAPSGPNGLDPTGIPGYSLGNALQSISTVGQQPPSSAITADTGSSVGTAHVETSLNTRVQDGDNGQPSPAPQSSAVPGLPESIKGLSRMAPEGLGFLIQVQGGEGTPGGYVGNPPAPVPFDISKANYEAVFTALGGALSVADSSFAQIDRNGDGVIGQDELLTKDNGKIYRDDWALVI
jgi:EF hand domain-containing protein